MNHMLSAMGISHHPFDPDGPLRACMRTPAIDLFCSRVAFLAQRGGFALLTGAPGTGKSVALRFVSEQLQSAGSQQSVAVIERPHASVADFYREIGHHYGLTLTPHNRWSGATQLRASWRRHADEACLQAVVLIDEAQEMSDAVLAELRLLASERLDAGWLLTVVLAGDDRLLDRLRSRTLAPLASRIRVRMRLEEQPVDLLAQVLTTLITTAGNPALFAEEVIQTLSEQAAGNLRTLMHLADQALTTAIENGATCVDQDVLLAAAHAVHTTTTTRRTTARGRRQQ